MKIQLNAANDAFGSSSCARQASKRESCHDTRSALADCVIRAPQNIIRGSPGWLFAMCVCVCLSMSTAANTAARGLPLASRCCRAEQPSNRDIGLFSLARATKISYRFYFLIQEAASTGHKSGRKLQLIHVGLRVPALPVHC